MRTKPIWLDRKHYFPSFRTRLMVARQSRVLYKVLPEAGWRKRFRYSDKWMNLAKRGVINPK